MKKGKPLKIFYSKQKGEVGTLRLKIWTDIEAAYDCFYGVQREADCELAAAMMKNVLAFIDEKNKLLSARNNEEMHPFEGLASDAQELLYKCDDIAKYWKLAKQGNAEAQFRVGESYYIDIENAYGEERVSMCKQRAVEWFQKAAAQGHHGAQRRLGDCYYLGCYVKRNLKQAAIWYQKSAVQGNLGALYALGCCYYFGIGMPVNNKRAVYFWKQAAIGPYREAAWEIKEFEKLRFCRKEAEKGDAKAQCKLAKSYQDTWSRFQREAQRVAVRWYRKAAKQGLAEAQLQLGNCYRYGQGVRRNYKMAFDWYEKAAAQNLSEAQWEIGQCYSCGQGVPRDAELSEKWCTLATKNGYRDLLSEISEGEIVFNDDDGIFAVEKHGYDHLRKPESIISITPYRKDGKALCKKLRSLRRKFAKRNGIPLRHRACAYSGACVGTCSACDAELRYLMNEAKKIPQGPTFE